MTITPTTYDPHTEPPDAAELAQMAHDDRLQREAQQRRDDAARARGECVPDAATRADETYARFVLTCRTDELAGNTRVSIERDGVLRVDIREGATTERVAGVLGDDWEVLEHAGATWARRVRRPDVWAPPGPAPF